MAKKLEMKQDASTPQLILVGTYRSACRRWLLTGHGPHNKSFYNLPFHGDIKDAKRYKSFTCAFLFSSDYGPLFRRIKYVGIVSGEKLKKDFSYPARKSPHSDSYALFELCSTMSLKDARNISVQEDSRFVICTDTIARSRHKWMDVLSCYVSSSKVAFDGWALTNKIPKWVCAASAYVPKNKQRISSQMDFLADLGFDQEADVWSSSVPVEKSSYLQDGTVRYYNQDGIVAEQGKLRMLDLFCGAGGFAVGAAWSGFQSVFGVDHLEPAMETWVHNHPHALGCLGDIRQVDPHEVRSILAQHGVDHIDLITGGVPCQGFSRANRKHTDTDERNFLFVEYMRFVREFMPPYIILENVSGMRSTAGGHFEDEIRNYMDGLGYEVTVKLVNAAAYGVPQIRLRLVFVGVRRNEGLTVPYEFPPEQFADHYRTVGDALSDLPLLGNDEARTQYELGPQNEYQAFMRGMDGSELNPVPTQLCNHVAPNHPQETINRIAHTLPGEPMYEAFKQRIRLDVNNPSPTQLAGGIRPQFQFGHPIQPRGLSIRERARIQSFPDWYEFMGGTVQERVQTGNAVPPLLIKAITDPIARNIRERA